MHAHSKLLIQVFPFRIHGIDEVDFLLPGACFDLFLSCKCIPNPLKFLISYQLIGIIAGGEEVFVLFIAVTFHAVFDVTGSTGVQDSVVFVGGNICVAFFRHGVVRKFWDGEGQAASELRGFEGHCVLVGNRLLRHYVPRRLWRCRGQYFFISIRSMAIASEAKQSHALILAASTKTASPDSSHSATPALSAMTRACHSNAGGGK